MRDPIPYVTRWPKSAGLWLDRLRTAMPEERVLRYEELSEADRAAARVAIVADPDPAALATLGSLEWVHSTWAGVEGILSELPADIGIARMVDPRLATTMSEAVLTAVLWLHRDGPRYGRQQARREWKHGHFVRPERRTIGVLGLGELGRAAAERLLANGFRVMGWSRSETTIFGIETFHGADGLGVLLSGSDIVVNLLPHTPDTGHLIDEQAIDRIKADAAVINFGRGATIDEQALLAGLDSGRLSHAFLDVFEHEPLPADHPFWTHEQVTVWPHVSAPTDADSASLVVAQAIQEWRSTGTPPRLVDRDRGY